MSRGLGLIQRTILAGLMQERSERLELSDLTVWKNHVNDGRPSSPSERASWRRAIRGLEARGLVATAMTWDGALEVSLTNAGVGFARDHSEFMNYGNIRDEWLQRAGHVPAEGASDERRERRTRRQREWRDLQNRSDYWKYYRSS